jgi:putative PIN family toxin of toxin-antitoxin system
MRVILDTNVLVSALLAAGSVPAQLLDAWFEGKFTLLTSEEQLEELRRVTRYPRIRAYVDPATAGSLVNDLRHFAEVVSPLPRVDVSADPGDNFLLAMAEAGRADYLVTADKRDVLALRRHGVTRIVTVRALLEVMERG